VREEKTRRLEIATPAGRSLVDLDHASAARLLLVLGHGSGGAVDAPDLVAVRNRCVAAGISVARVTQPYRVAGKKAPPSAATLDAGWAAVITALGRRPALAKLGFVYGGRSAGARVACRAAADKAIAPRPAAVLALAFPVHPPGRPDKDRMAELDAVPVPALVVQGDRDPFGMPDSRTGRDVVVVAGDHSLKKDVAAVAEAVLEWLTDLC